MMKAKMKVQGRFIKQYAKAMQMHFAGRSHSQILTMLQDGFTDAVSARTLTYWIADFKTWDKEAISREAPFELHLIEEYGLPIEATKYIGGMFYEMSTTPSIPMFLSTAGREWGETIYDWKPTVRDVDWWWKVHNMTDDFSYQDVYLMATHYSVREHLELISGIPADYSDLNAFMTYQPWRSMKRTEHYEQAIGEGRFKKASDEDYGDRGIMDAEGGLAVGHQYGIIWNWGQMKNKKQLSPYKALMFQFHVSSVLGDGIPIEQDEDGDWYGFKGELTESNLEYIFDEEELEDIREFIEEARNES